MAEPASEIEPVIGDEFRPALVKLWTMLLVFLLMIPGGALTVWHWWFQVPLAGRHLSARAGIVGLLAIPLAMALVLVMGLLLASAKRLIVGERCVQLISRGRVVVQVPFENVADIYSIGEGKAGVIGLKLRDRNDSATLVPARTRDRYEIQVLTYGKSLSHIHEVVSKRLSAFRAAAS